MKKLFVLLLVTVISSIFLISCSDSPTGGSGSSGEITKRYPKTTPPVFFEPGTTSDLVIVPDTGFTSSLLYELDSILGVDVTRIDIMLEHNGIVDTLVHNLTNPGNNFILTKFSDSATDSIKNGSGNYTGTYKPYRPLSVFNGQSILGLWNLQINYWGNLRTGVIKSWGITISYNKSIPSTGGAILPLTVGNYWILARDTGGVQNVYQDTLRITGQSIVHGKQVYWMQWGYYTDISYVRNESDGLWYYGSPNDTISQPYLNIKYPISLNETYIARSDTITCVSTNATWSGYSGCIKYFTHDYYKNTIKHNAQIFNRIKGKSLYDNPEAVINFYDYFKPGLGYIGGEIDYGFSSYITRLIQYNVQ